MHVTSHVRGEMRKNVTLQFRCQCCRLIRLAGQRTEARNVLVDINRCPEFSRWVWFTFWETAKGEDCGAMNNITWTGLATASVGTAEGSERRCA